MNWSEENVRKYKVLDGNENMAGKFEPHITFNAILDEPSVNYQ